jgi:hypothetical protein
MTTKDIAQQIERFNARVTKRLGDTKAPEVSIQKNATCGALAMALLHSATVAHLMHFQTRSRSDHQALQGYYEEIPGIVDRFVEAYQGRYGVLDQYPDPMPSGRDPIPYFQTLRSFIDEARHSTAPDSHLQNIIDEAVALIDATIYQLTALK